MGDEFAFFLVGLVDRVRAEAMAKELLEAIRRPIVTSAGTHRIGAAVGVVVTPATGISTPSTAAQFHRAELSEKLAKRKGRLGGEITGQMIEVPGQTNRYSTLGAGVTWRTPWRAKLSVGAQNLITRGKNPFGLPDDQAVEEDEEGRVPYVRYQQDL